MSDPQSVLLLVVLTLYSIVAVLFAAYGAAYTCKYGYDGFFDRIRLDSWGIGTLIVMIIPLMLYTGSSFLWSRGVRVTDSQF